MNNEQIKEKSWWKRNWKWLLPTLFFIFILGLGLMTITGNGKNINDLTQAYSDNSLFENAFEKAKTNQRVIAILGVIEPIDKLAILEGNTKYSNNNNSVDLTVRIIGNKGKGKLDVSAVRNGATWEYRKINVRIKQTQEEIHILKTKL
ncbi:cytochrome c oxidase assembly factor Coa1 family protein [Flavobacterium sp. K5-23]|uniref:cytochrome c oxidase assembly factor Coa1 family protein n=1 Tax=Flavobacterium sp. K5-23 TaxID=2746225 RepID=UPI00200F3EDE|nr:cytochrome c oxidase assembly factor Coa1 family protein [Flavobacterium sp. K5-23]UQD57509.1 hypothetical protein FLAK523_14340 [Flavobacterium sp. K5-23]